MKNTELLRKIAIIIGILALLCLVVFGLVLHGMGATLAEPGTSSPYLDEIEVDETKTLKVSNAYSWVNSDPSVLELKAEKGVETATIKGKKPGIATVSAGTAVGQVLSFTYKIIDKPDDGGDSNGGNDEKPLEWIPGLSSETPVDTVLNIEGDNWIVIKNTETEGSRYAMLLKQTALPQKCYSLSGGHYEGSDLQREFNRAWGSSYIPEALISNAVVPKLGDDSTSAVSAPTSKMAAANGITKDIIFPLSYKEAFDWGNGTPSDKLNLSRQRWWLRTPNGNQWYYIMSYTDSPDQGNIVSTPTVAINGNDLYLRPAIWVKYLDPLG